MEFFIQEILTKWYGSLGIVALLIQLADLYLKRLDKKGAWESIGSMFRGTGKQIGTEFAEKVPGDKVEAFAIRLLERAKDLPDEFLRGLIAGLNEGINDPEKKIDIPKE